MRKPLTGAVVVGLVALAIYLSDIWNGPGQGAGTGRSQTSQNSEEADQSDMRNVSVSARTQPRLVAPDPSQSAGEAPKFVTVVVHDDTYRLAKSGDLTQGEDAPLPDVIEAVKAAEGSKEGIRVRVVYEKSAQEGARTDLFTAFQDAGIRQEEIQEQSGFVD